MTTDETDRELIIEREVPFARELVWLVANGRLT